MASDPAMPDAAGWDAAVQAYVEFAESDTGAFAAPMLASAAVRTGERAIDVAAGTGALTAPLVEVGATVTAIDWSEGMIAHLAHRLQRIAPGGGHAALRMDGQALEFADGAFDLALSLFGVMLFPDFRAGMSEMARVTRAGGRCVVGCWADLTAPMRLFHDAVAVALPDFPAIPPVGGMAAMGTPAGMTVELERVGLRAVRVESVTRPWGATRREIAAAAPRMLAQMPPWPALSDDQRTAVVAAMDEIADRDADRPFESTALIGVGFKPG